MKYNFLIYRAFLRGDREGVDPIYLLYKNLLIRFGLSYTSRMDVVEDAVADTFELLLDRIGSFKDEEHIHKWLHGVVKQKILNEIRKSRRLIALAEEPEDESDLSAQELIDIRGSAVYIQFIIQLIYRKLKKLPKQQRRDFYAHFFENKSIAEIAWRRKTADITVRQNVDRAVKKIQLLLKKC